MHKGIPLGSIFSGIFGIKQNPGRRSKQCKLLKFNSESKRKKQRLIKKKKNTRHLWYKSNFKG